MVYHSHLLEHLDRDAAVAFLEESYRVLRPGGIVRIVVPDLELIVRRYVSSLDAALNDSGAAATHDESIASIYEQSVRREGVGTAHQPAFIRLIERVVLGDARRKGETHQWMYDRVSLRIKLETVGFREVTLHSFDTSGYPRWNEVGLDREGAGAYKPGSLYIEAIRPG